MYLLHDLLVVVAELNRKQKQERAKADVVWNSHTSVLHTHWINAGDSTLQSDGSLNESRINKEV